MKTLNFVALNGDIVFKRGVPDGVGESLQKRFPDLEEEGGVIRVPPSSGQAVALSAAEMLETDAYDPRSDTRTQKGSGKG